MPPPRRKGDTHKEFIIKARPRQSSIWRVFYTKPRSEKRLARKLEQAGYEILLPLRASIHQWSDRKKLVEEPLFPGYLFAHVTEKERLGVLQEEAIVRCVGFGGVLATVTPTDIALLRTLLRLPDHLEAIEREAFPVGSEVYVYRGPLRGVRGRVSDHPKAHYIIVDVPSIRQTVRVRVPMDWVRRPAGFTQDIDVD